MMRFLKQKRREIFVSIIAGERLPVLHSRFGRQWR